MEEIQSVDYWQLLQPLIWLLGSFGIIVSGLLGWIVVLLRSDKDGINIRLEKHEGWILENNNYTRTAIALIEQEQKNNREHFDQLEKYNEERITAFENSLANAKKKR